MNYSTFLKQVSHIVNIDAHKTLRSVEHIHDAAFNLSVLFFYCNFFVNEGKNGSHVFWPYHAFLFFHNHLSFY